MVKVGLADPVSFRASETPDAIVKKAIGMVQTNAPISYAVYSSPVKPAIAEDNVSFENDEKKADLFKAHIKDRQWKKTYSPETNLVFVRNKKIADMPEYTISQDGTVHMKSSNLETSTILEQDIEASQVFNKTKNKKHFSLKGIIAGIWKFGSVTNQMAKSTIQGIVYGTVTGAAFLGGSWLFSSLPKAFTKEGPSLKEVIKSPLKHIAKSGKVMAGIAAAAVLAYNLVIGKLQANQNTAVIDHKIYSGHRDK